MLRAPLWSSSFRPFYLLGGTYALLMMLVWIGVFAGWGLPLGEMPLRLWHGHEMVYGFASAIILGILFTALPSWAGTEELRGFRLALLALLWVAGRAAFWCAPVLPPSLVAGIDCALFLFAALIVTPQLLKVENRYYLLVLPVFAGLFAGNALYHAAIQEDNGDLATAGLTLGIYSIILLYVLKGGVLTPIFTGNVLRQKGRGDQTRFCLALEVAAVASVVILAAADVLRLPAPAVAVLALAACVIHALRAWRWQGWKVADEPLVFVMHLGFAWLVVSFALKATAAFGLTDESAWLHAFTVGGLGMMMMGLMTRVALRHTGRSLSPPAAIKLAYASMFAAALVRVLGGLQGAGPAVIVVSALLWAIPFALFLALFARVLLSPSLPRPPQRAVQAAQQ